MKGWPVPTVEYRRKIWDRDMSLMEKSLSRFEEVLKISAGQEAI